MIDLRHAPGRLDDLLGEIRRWSDGNRPAVILGASPNGLAFIRSIGGRGIPVLVLEGPKPQPGLVSRFATGLLLPDPVAEEERWLAVLDEIGRASPMRPVLIPTGDAHVLLISRNRKRLGSRYRFLLPDEEILEKLPNKKEQYELAIRSGVPVPLTFYPGSEEEAIQAAAETAMPCIIKPYYSHLWKRHKEAKLEEVDNIDDLLRIYREAESIGQPVMIQEKIPGGDDSLYGLLAYYDRHSNPLCLFTKRKLRQYPVDYGDGSFQISIRDDELRDLGDRFFRTMNYRGLGSVEFKKDERTGEFKLIEVNPRSVSGQGMTTKSGMDMPWLAYLDIGCSGVVRRTEEYDEGVCFVNFRWDVKSFLQNRSLGRLTFLEWLGSFSGRRVGDAFFQWRDPRPAWMVFSGMARSLFRR